MNASAYRILWRWVIKQAVEDARWGFPDESRTARIWLTVDSEDLRQVCEFAGIDPEALRASVMERLVQA